MNKPQVLIVDDDKDILMMLSLIFDQAGAEVETMTNAELASEKVALAMKEGNPFDLIVTDIRMPNVNGNEFTKKVRQDGFSGAIVAFTSVATGKGKRESNDAGINRYFDKNTANVELARALLEEYCSGPNYSDPQK